jgi:hypothetical protein
MTLVRYLAILYLALALFGCCTANCSKNNIPSIPQAVIKKLDSIFPGDKQVKWTKYSRKYRADFLYKGLNVSISFERDGNIIAGTEEIEYSALPSVISDKIQQKYATFKILMITLIYRKNSIQYEIEVIRGGSHYILNYNAKGGLMHQYDLIKSDLTQNSSD